MGTPCSIRGETVQIEKRNGNGTDHVAVAARRSRGRPKKSAEAATTQVQYHVTLPQSLAQRLDAIKKSTNAGSLSDVFRTALLVYGYVLEEHQAGGRLYFRRANDELERQIQLFL